MSRQERGVRVQAQRFPRVSGDEPAPTVAHATRVKFSPRERG